MRGGISRACARAWTCAFRVRADGGCDVGCRGWGDCGVRGRNPTQKEKDCKEASRGSLWTAKRRTNTLYFSLLSSSFLLHTAN